jgi:hypothetical protein
VSWRAATARAVAARGEAAVRLRKRLLDGPMEGLTGVVSEGATPWLVVWGEPLPWVDGAVFLGVPDGAPSLYVPTRRAWELPPELLEARALAACSPGDAPVAWLDDALVPLGPGRPLDRDVLEALVLDGGVS